MKKYLSIMFIAIFAFCGIAFAQEVAAGTGEAVSDGGSWGYVIAALIAVINAILSFFPNSKESWWYKLLSWVSVRFGK